ncbi:hypothetical protein CPC08DRAFT_818810 [Agrocybe pediades]|nr:hypothetical protein CPC08DRAFT_818810 [Agrocybe pediades]
MATVWVTNEDNITRGRDIGNGQKAVFSETIFHDIRMMDGVLKTSVDLQIPTAAFKRKHLNNYDLRASFVLIPKSPSLLDTLSNYSTWIPSDAKNPPVRTYPPEHAPSLAEEVIDSYGISLPLLSFNNIVSRCPYDFAYHDQEEQFNEEPELYDESGAKIEEVYIDFALFDFQDSRSKENAKKPQNCANTDDVDGWTSTEHHMVQGTHPYVITMTHLSIIDATKSFNRNAFEKAHGELSKVACGREALEAEDFTSILADWRFCERSFPTNGNHEVAIEYEATDRTDESQTQEHNSALAYAPYLFVDRNAWGPLDLLAVPVNRENCSDEAFEEPGVMNIKWNIVFSSRTPDKYITGHFMASSLIDRGQFDMVMTPFEELENIQAKIELQQAFLGNKRRENHQPLAGFVLRLISLVLLWLEPIIQAHYWLVCVATSSAGISMTGAYLIAAADLSDHIMRKIAEAEDYHSFPSFTWFKFVFDYQILFQEGTIMLAAMSGLGTLWTRRSPSQPEIANTAVKLKPSRKTLQLAFILLAACSYFFHLQPIYIVHGKLPLPVPQTALIKILDLIQCLIIFPMFILGQSLQVIMNFKAQTFSGMHKLGALCGFFGHLLELLASLPWSDLNLGRGEHVELWAMFMMRFVYYAVMALQALMYPKAGSIENYVKVEKEPLPEE